MGGVILPSSDLTIIPNTYTNVADSGTKANGWTFSDPNYQSASGSATVSITPATAVVTVTPYNVTYDAQQNEATVVATGVGLDTNLASSVNLSGTEHTNSGPPTPATPGRSATPTTSARAARSAAPTTHLPLRRYLFTIGGLRLFTWRMGPPCSVKISRVPTYSSLPSCSLSKCGTFTLRCRFPTASSTLA